MATKTAHNQPTEPEAEETTAVPKPKRRLISDPELAAMNEIGEHLNALDETTRARVLAWVFARYSRPGDSFQAHTKPQEV